MSQLIFQSVSSGSVTLNGPNTAGTYNLAIPAADGTLLYSDLSGLITFNNVNITGQLTLTGTTALGIPVGNTAQRPVGAAGLIRYNTDGGGLYEGYLPSVSAWYKFSMVPQGEYTIQYLIISGGGGGGGNSGGGGGAGGYLSGTFTALPSTGFTVTIGGGGAAGSNGSNSSITGVATGTGGGKGGTFGPGNGAFGGSGGGGSGCQAPGQSSFGGNGSPPQGNSGGGSGSDPYTNTGGGGGGGASYAGAGGGFSAGGAGGDGTPNAITGITTTYAGGGGGASPPYIGGTSGGAGGAGGGGAGGGYGVGGTNGTINTGGGGGGANSGTAGSGGSGVVILSIPTANYTGTVTGLPTVTTSGSNTIVKFTISGSYTA